MNMFNRMMMLWIVAAISIPAHAALDLTAITGAITGEELVAGIAAVAGILVLPRAARWGYRQVMAMFR